jgi:putative transposase
MKLTVQVKLLPSKEQAEALKETLRASNVAANEISGIAWERRSFGQYKLHKLAYHHVRASSDLASQMVVRAIAKVADAYKLDGEKPKRRHTFRPLGAIAYDDRILRWKGGEVSIWTTAGRQTIPFVCGERTAELLKSRQGESDLLRRDGKWFLLATVNVEEPPPGTPEDWIGIDLGIKNVAVDSTGESHSGSRLKGLRHRYVRIRSRLQARQTEAARKLLKKRGRKEQRMAKHENHVISKHIVRKAQDTNSGIALEDLKGIRDRITARRPQRRTLHSWSFHQLADFVSYKAALAGVPVVFVDPRNTSRTCTECGHIDKRNRPNRDTFRCTSCGFVGLADSVAAEIIRRAAVNQPNLGCGVAV